MSDALDQPVDDQPVSLYAHAAKFGAILAIISIICVIIFYVIDIAMLAGWMFIVVALVISIGGVIYAGINYRGEIGGYISYGNAFIHAAVLMAVSGAITTVFNILLYTVIDTELAEKMTAVIVENTESMMRKFGAPDSSIDEAINKMRDDMPKQFTAGGLAWSYVKNLIGVAVIAAITSIFVKKSRPVEM